MKQIIALSSIIVIMICGCSKKDAKQSQVVTKPPPVTETYSQSLATNGNHYDTFNFPSPDTVKGVLDSVNIRLVESLNYTFSLENGLDSAFTYDLRLGREDFISAAFLPVALHDSIVKDYFYPLAASDGVTGSGPDFIQVNNLPVLQAYTAIDTTLGASLFAGVNAMNLNHQSLTFGYVQNGSAYELHGSAADSMTLSVQYYYSATQ
jgi:hypothetical protein